MDVSEEKLQNLLILNQGRFGRNGFYIGSGKDKFDPNGHLKAALLSCLYHCMN